jgi:crotonobetainyl-CoA:carnitine CoA-transferase CaiB-like acyl-CoA transferase
MIMDAQAALQDLLKLAVLDPKRDDDVTIGGDDPVLPTNYLLGAAGAALSALGFSPEALAELRPGTVYVSLSAYGHQGPWRLKRGFDSLVQSVSGIVHDESQGGTPRHLPAQALDYVSGYLMAFGAMVALAPSSGRGELSDASFAVSDWTLDSPAWQARDWQRGQETSRSAGQ